MDFVEPKYVSLKDHPTYNERWLQERIVDNPSLLGLGDVDVRDSERPQPSAGRLDLLLFDPETKTRYEVELQLGPTDESHLVRTLEYWDIERKRYPQYEHIAVIVAEDVTSRFLNVIGLFNQAIPLIAIQIRAVQVNGMLTLVATQVLGLMSLGTIEEEGETVDRGFWERKASLEALEVCDGIVAMINTIKPNIQEKYNKHYIGLTGRQGVQNFVAMTPRKAGFVIASFKIPFNEETDSAIDESSLDKLPYEKQWRQFRVRIRKSDLVESGPVIKQLIELAHEHFGVGG